MHRFLKASVGSLALVALAGGAYGVQPDNLTVVVPSSHVTGGLTGASLGGFAYNPTTRMFYIGVFGTHKLYRVYDETHDTSDQYVSVSDTERVMRSSDLAAGAYDSNDSGGALPSGMALNPTELTIGGITYPAGAICFITDGGLVVKDDGIVLREDWTKRVLRWDLRKVGAPAGSLTDHNGNGIAD